MLIFGTTIDPVIVVAIVSAITAILTAILSNLFKLGTEKASSSKITAETTDFLIKSAKELLAPYKEEAEILRKSNTELIKLNKELKDANEALKKDLAETHLIADSLREKCDNLTELLNSCKECLEKLGVQQDPPKDISIT